MNDYIDLPQPPESLDNRSPRPKIYALLKPENPKPKRDIWFTPKNDEGLFAVHMGRLNHDTGEIEVILGTIGELNLPEGELDVFGATEQFSIVQSNDDPEIRREQVRKMREQTFHDVAEIVRAHFQEYGDNPFHWKYGS